MKLELTEGEIFVYREIEWKGNSKYTDEQLNTVLGLAKGDVFNPELLEKRLRFSVDGRDISSLYLDDGYLFFDVQPIEVAVEGNEIDIEMRIYEGPQATIDQVTIAGNDRTHENVVRRSVRTHPGQKFSRSDIIRSQREISNLGYFNPETLDVQTPVNQERGTVDIHYVLEERPSDQLELSAGYGGFQGLIGTLGVTFNNFSLANFKDRTTWNPLPQGDGQKLSIRAQSNSRFFRSMNWSFTEPWLGGKKPNSFTTGMVYTSLSVKVTPPYSLFRKGDINVALSPEEEADIRETLRRNRGPADAPSADDYAIELNTASVAKRYKYLEYHKWRFDAEWYYSLVGKLVFAANIKMGLVGFYDENLGIGPFERFELGGDGLSNQNIGVTGRDIISLRGYETTDIEVNNTEGGGSIFDKVTLELRYPISTNPSSTIYVHGFVQGANSWIGFENFNPFQLQRSAGGGLRVFLPMFGLLGFDYGWGFDKNINPANGGFGNFNIVLGFEPD